MYGQAGSGAEIVTALLAALGLQMSGFEFLGGLFLAIAGALSASRILAHGMVRNAKPMGFLGTVLLGAFISLVVALFCQSYWPEWKVQLPMAVAGFFSSFVGPMALKVASGLSSRSDEAADRIMDRILPDSGRKD